MKLILTDKAYRSILDECLAAPETETGCILVGKKIDEQRVVAPFALGPGLKTLQTRIRFAPDVKWQQVYLEKLFNRYSVNYVGSYHRHPGNYCQPSSLDLKAARQIVSDPEWNVREAIFPIINLTGGRIKLYAYHLSRASDEFCSIDWQIISHRDRLIKHVLRKENL